MRTARFLLVALMSATPILPLWGQLADAGPETRAKCEQYLRTPLPKEADHVPTPKKWPSCASYKLYSGIETHVDYVAARSCAWSERLATKAGLEPRFTIGSVFGGAAMLTQIYANGEGVEKNIPLALRFTCEAEGAPAEISIRVESLETLRDNPAKQSDKFAFCDATTSGFMMGFCTAYGSELAEQKRKQQLAELSQNWTVPQLIAFRSLVQAEEAYASAHARGEVDLSGTARAMYEIEEEDGVRDNFLEALKAYEKGALPRPSGSAVESDKTLNQEYKKAIAEAEAHKDDYGALQPEGIRGAERTWIKYRDAWAAFVKIRYPSVSESAWIQLLSDDRVLVLTGKCCGSDPDDKDAAKNPRPLP
jgi:hypothetical protein